MITTIDNNQRVFKIQRIGWANDKIFCNLNDIQKCMEEMGNEEPYVIHEFWNYGFRKVSRKKLIEYLQANQIKVTIKIK